MQLSGSMTRKFGPSWKQSTGHTSTQSVCLQLMQFSVTTWVTGRSEEHTSELQSLMRISYAVFCLKKKLKQRSRAYYYFYCHTEKVDSINQYYGHFDVHSS